ncbi:hypothetical protein GC105_15350 [Alkalibaculum sp. M08DMB]|uniref:DUF8180 domain-containing protein n=1 Tax=Alkalibaculum sporogenes TaxID=2655001 RepID=A0A6A7KDQ3_9FIRM|nr:hypothetical protein [Alkalibaculum sporogenes]MPW27153.1 hypothetical protein [Alkalibaculum sporogenes]
MEDIKMKELKALLNHLIGHNENHADEIKQLAQRAKDLEIEESYELMIKGTKELQNSNVSLKKAYDLLPKEA